MSGPITPLDPRWNTSYPNFRAPAQGESLPGYLLALDELNGLPAGTTVWAVKQKDIGMPNFCAPAPYLRAPSLNLEDVAAIAGGRSVDEIRLLTLAPVLDWLFGSHRVTLSAAPAFRICPACAAQRQVPLVSLLEHLAGCATHGLVLIERCLCSEPIRPFLNQIAFSCSGPGCVRRYDQLPAVSLSAPMREESEGIAAVYRDLMRAAPSASSIEGAAHLSKALRFLIHLDRLGKPDHQQLRWRAGVRPGLRAVADVLLATRRGAADLQHAIEETRVTRRARIVRARCPNPACGGSDLLVCSGEQQCRTCGTRFNHERILFSFDEQPGYSPWRARANQRRLVEAHARVRVVCADYLVRDETIEREPVLRAARVPHNSIPHLSPRAGVVDLIRSAQFAQQEARLCRARAATAEVDAGEPDLQRRVELLGLAHAIGVTAACRKMGVPRSRFYRWKAAYQRAGFAGLRQTCRLRRSGGVASIEA